MREKLKNDLLLLLDTYINASALSEIDQKLNVMLSDYEIESRKTELVIYEYQIPNTVEIYIVSKKISGLSDKSLLPMPRTPVTLVVGWIYIQSEIKREVYIRKWGEVSGKGL